MAQGRSFNRANAIFPSIVATGSKTFNPANLVDGAGESTDVTATGAVLGDFALASFSVDTEDVMLVATVTAADTVTVRFQNESTVTHNLASGTLRVICFNAKSGLSSPH